MLALAGMLVLGLGGCSLKKRESAGGNVKPEAQAQQGDAEEGQVLSASGEEADGTSQVQSQVNGTQDAVVSQTSAQTLQMQESTPTPKATATPTPTPRPSPTPTPAPRAVGSRTGSAGSVKLINSTGFRFRQIYLQPETMGDWGKGLLAPETSIHNGDRIELFYPGAGEGVTFNLLFECADGSKRTIYSADLADMESAILRTDETGSFYFTYASIRDQTQMDTRSAAEGGSQANAAGDSLTGGTSQDAGLGGYQAGQTDGSLDTLGDWSGDDSWYVYDPGAETNAYDGGYGGGWYDDSYSGYENGESYGSYGGYDGVSGPDWNYPGLVSRDDWDYVSE